MRVRNWIRSKRYCTSCGTTWPNISKGAVWKRTRRVELTADQWSEYYRRKEAVSYDITRNKTITWSALCSVHFVLFIFSCRIWDVPTSGCPATYKLLKWHLLFYLKNVEISTKNMTKIFMSSQSNLGFHPPVDKILTLTKMCLAGPDYLFAFLFPPFLIQIGKFKQFGLDLGQFDNLWILGTLAV